MNNESEHEQPSRDPYDAHFTSDDARDAFVEGLVRFEQIEARLPNHAKLVAVYYHSLLKEGVPGEVTLLLVRDYAAALTYNGY